jgi:hypothetical protein
MCRRLRAAAVSDAVIKKLTGPGGITASHPDCRAATGKSA